MTQLPVIDVGPLLSRGPDRDRIADQLGRACSEFGFFYVVNHGVDETHQHRLEQLSRQFFALDPETKLRIHMSHGGRAWRGYFPVGGELTSAKPDMKEGIYFGEELSGDDPRVRAGTPLHGPNLFPSEIPEMRDAVLQYMAAMTRLGHVLISGIALSLGLEESYFEDHYTANPLVLFRIFNYPFRSHAGAGVGEHTDYGLLTILRQDMAGGLQVKHKSGWIDAVPVPNSFVCNVGDMLDRLTRGRYLSVPHRVMHVPGRDRLSFAFFFDPDFNAQIQPVRPDIELRDNKDERWDHASVHEFSGTYGEYLLGKVSRVFPDLGRDVL